MCLYVFLVLLLNTVQAHGISGKDAHFLQENNGQASLKQIYRYVKITFNEMSREIPPTIEFNVRGRIYENAPDAGGYKKGNKALFYKVSDKPTIWGIREEYRAKSVSELFGG